jgi:hypothetical protein
MPVFPRTRQVEMFTDANLDYVGKTKTSASVAPGSINKLGSLRKKYSHGKAHCLFSMYTLESHSSCLCRTV